MCYEGNGLVGMNLTCLILKLDLAQITYVFSQKTIGICNEEGGWHTVKPVLNSHSQKDPNWFSRPIIALCRSKVLQNAPRGAFCNTVDLH